MISNFFIRRPIVAMVIAIVTVLAGLIAMRGLPLAQFPEIVPPQIIASTTYPGADAITIEQSVSTPMEQQMNGVDNMLYMQSTNANDGTQQLTVTFDIDTDVNIDQVNVQNRVAQAQPNLPAEVNQFGMNIRKSTGLPLIVFTLFSPNKSYDDLFLANYANININDVLYRIPGVGQIILFGASDYAMRIWVKQDFLAKLAALVPVPRVHLITEATQVSLQGVGYPNTPGIHTPQQVAGWRLVTDAVHARGGKIFLQLWHTGRISHPSMQPGGELPVAPSAIPAEGQIITYEGWKPFVTPRALKTEEIPGVVEQFKQGARNALEAGFDGVEIHAANGHLIDQFLRDGTNRRTDAYDGSVENRARFLLEVVEAVSEVWNAERVGVRISPTNAFNSMSDSDPATTFGYVAERLGRLGLAYLHVVEGTESENGEAFFREKRPAMGFRRLREAFGGTYMANGGYDFERAEASLARGDADLVSFGRLFLANPDLPKRFARNAPLNMPDPATFYGGGERGYTDYPRLELQTA
jgi:N-ethylmaleimide reductase